MLEERLTCALIRILGKEKKRKKEKKKKTAWDGLWC